jgi:hypothetical protein
MPTLVLNDVPVPLYEQIQRMARKRQRTAADTVLEVLETVFRTTTPAFVEAPLPQEPFLTEEICAPFSIPRPEGKPARAVRVAPPLPSAHDLPDEE